MGMMASAADDLELRTASLTPGLMIHQGEAANEGQTGHIYLGSLCYFINSYNLYNYNHIDYNNLKSCKGEKK